MEILIVEDESVVAMELENFLKEEGFTEIGIATNGQEAFQKATKHKPNIVLMDINLDGEEDGIETVNCIKMVYDVATIYLTAFTDDETIERAIQTDPVGYLVKPINQKELMATIKIALKSKSSEIYPQAEIIFNKDFSYDPTDRQLIYRGEFLHLTKRERQLLHLLVLSKNQIVSIERMESEIWPDKAPNENTRRSLVNRLRAKLKHQFIETISSIGYRINY